MKKKGELKTLFLFLQERECLPPSYSLKFVEGVKLSFCLILSAFQKAVSVGHPTVSAFPDL